MNPLKAIKALTKVVRDGATRRNAEMLISSSPSVFRHTPSGDKRYQAVLYFADGIINAYQLRQWYEPMRRLAEHVPVVVLIRNVATAATLRDECPLPLFVAKTITDVEDFLTLQDVRAVFYVNQNIRNFQMMRFNSPAHIFVSHGESEKAYMWSNQLKAYDFVFSAGQAARDRLAKNMTRFDAVERTRMIGRPQIDVAYATPVELESTFKTVLYAPTWEGDRPSMSYGSVESHGLSMMHALVAEGQYNIIFRPHPRSGVNSKAYRDALTSIRELFSAGRQAGAPSYVYDTSDTWGWQWKTADICVTDISAVAYDWLATAKPLLITTPKNQDAAVDDSPALLSVPGLTSSDAAAIGKRIKGLLENPDPDFEQLVEYYFGDTTPGASMQRFLDESIDIIETTSTATPS